MTRDHHDDTTRYWLELDMLERDAALGDRAGADLLRSEFALALNASYFMALSGGDIEIGAVERSVPQEGVVRYAVELLLEERASSCTDEQVAERLQREFARAQNASHFIRIASEDFDVILASRERVGSPQVSLRAA